jgi:uncharacterized protein with ParB-like and HNH nuclease domain
MGQVEERNSKRRLEMTEQPDNVLDPIQSEIEDQDTVPASYDIVTYPADYTLELLVSKFTKTIIVPGFQRKFVWTLKQASRLIESFLLGLPVPAIFLYSDPKTGKLLVIDGQQRLLSISYFFEGYFGEPDSKGRRAVFKLQGLNEKSPYDQLTYQDLRSEDESAYNRLNESVLRAFIVKQLRPEGSSSIYHIFERLNTGGTQLVGQEIRNCIYYGPFNDLLIALNRTAEWRAIFGKSAEDKRMRDMELVLRFLALYYLASDYRKPMKGFLSEFMEKHRDDDAQKLSEYERLFRDTTQAIHKHLPPRPFHIRTGLNAAAFDGIYVAFARNMDRVPADILDRYHALIGSARFAELVNSGTTDEDVVRDRMKEVEEELFG